MCIPTAVLLLHGLKPAHRLQTVANKYDTLAFLLTSVNQAAPKRQSQATQRCVDARRLPKLNSKTLSCSLTHFWSHYVFWVVSFDSVHTAVLYGSRPSCRRGARPRGPRPPLTGRDSLARQTGGPRLLHG